ncbi:cation-translocating P-type ATPase [Piscinibacter sp. HJYY11]|nr:cation-translocating P-type ATPase [Piscinibacter sp. HJYY11]
MPTHPPRESGLSEAEAALRLQRDGANRLPSPDHRSAAATLVSAALQPMVMLLLACTLLYALLGELMDGAALGVSIAVVLAISVYQELRTQRVLEALRDLASPRSTVIRDGVVRRISSQELVVGDRLLVEEGDRLACDAALVQAHALRVDESLLTGESMPVDKQPESPGAEGQLHAGTLVVQGDGVALVTATGTRTTLGQIGGSMAALPARESRLHLDLKRLVRGVAYLALLVCLVATTVFAWREGSWTAGLLVGLTLAMATVPEEFAVVWTVMLAIGAWRLARLKVLTRQPQAIEALGSTTVLCVDKTGTLTCNQMEVVGLQTADGAAAERRPSDAPDPRWQALIETAALASVRESLEPMDQAIFRLSSADGTESRLSLVARDGVAPGHPFVRQVWRHEATREQWAALKGAPEAIFSLCAQVPEAVQAQAERWASSGMRVIAVARAAGSEPSCELQGLLAFEDPLRADVPAALTACHAAGVRVVMITGDAPATALSIARQAGLVRDGAPMQVLTGAQIDAMNEAQFEGVVMHVAVFARIAPAQKLRIVQALQRRGEVVAMTGDGVNDGPALRAADIGVAMGARGTDVAREAASLVLLDDRFASLVDALSAGRRIFDNLQKAIGYLFAVHVPIVGLSLLPVLGGPVLLLPLHVVLFELIIDPACSLVFEAEPASPEAMTRPPRPSSARLFAPRRVARALGVGLVALAFVAGVQWMARAAGATDEELRLAGIACVVVGNLAMLQWFRGRGAVGRPNRMLQVLVLAVCAAGALITLVPAVSLALGLPTLQAGDVLIVLAAPALWAAWQLWRGQLPDGGKRRYHAP